MISYSIGKGEKNDVVFNKKGVSKYHGFLEYYDGNICVISDNQSTNGVWVCGRRVERCKFNFSKPTEKKKNVLNDNVKLGDNLFNLDKFFRFYDGFILEPKEENDFTDYFPELVKAEVQYNQDLDDIHKKSRGPGLAFRLSFFAGSLLSGLYLIKQKDWALPESGRLWIPILSGALSTFFYVQMMSVSRKKEVLRAKAMDRKKLKMCCPNPACRFPIHDSTNLMQQKEEAICRSCKAVIYKKDKVTNKEKVNIPIEEKKNTNGDISNDPPMVQVVTGNGEKFRYDLNYGLNIIGRGKGDEEKKNYIQIPTSDQSLSKRHLGIKVFNQLVGREWVLAVTCLDLASEQGSSIKGFEKSPLSPYDVIYINHKDEMHLGKTKVTLIAPLSRPLLKAKVKAEKGTYSQTMVQYRSETQII